MNFFLQIFLIGLIASVLNGCSGESKGHNLKQALHSYTLSLQAVEQHLHFTGTIQPLHEYSLVSPAEAVIERMNVHYGQRVKKDEVVMVLNSNELQKQYNETLTDYLKAKDSYSIARAKFVGTEDLWSAGLISKNNYLSEKSGVDTARVALMQATRKLTEMLDKMDDSAKNLSSLSLSDFDKVKSVLTAKHNLIQLKSSGDGVLLYPPKSTEDKNTRLGTGAAVKSGQVLALIGDLQGISVEIDVPEVDIDKVHVGMGAVVSGIAFGKQQLKGQLVAVNAQASNTGNSGLPSFSAVVEVNDLTPEQQQWIKVGMSASIELNAEGNKELLLPIAAVKREKGHSVVLVQEEGKSPVKRLITTGPVQADKVVVESGLKAGDVVVYE